MHLAIGLEYDGGSFHGWQRQADVASVQAAVEAALSRVADRPVAVAAAGRTDTGVHAMGQVASFRTDAVRRSDAWVLGTNAHLPPTVRVRWCRAVDDHFHARFSATARRYLYLISDTGYPGALAAGHVLTAADLDDERMHRAVRLLVGERDFSAFRAAGCQSSTPVRHLHHAQVTRFGRIVVVDVAANAFVLHMVRNIVGSLLEVGRGRRPEFWLAELLVDGDRAQAAPTAPAHGLYLLEVRYGARAFPVPDLPPLLQALGGIDRL